MNFDYIPLDKAVIDENVKEFEQNRKVVLSKIRFDKGFENSVIALDFMNELLVWNRNSKVNIRHVVFNVAYNYLDGAISNINMVDDRFEVILIIVNRWSHAFKCAYDHSSSINFSWAFNELLKEVNHHIKLWAIEDNE